TTLFRSLRDGGEGWRRASGLGGIEDGHIAFRQPGSDPGCCELRRFLAGLARAHPSPLSTALVNHVEPVRPLPSDDLDGHAVLLSAGGSRPAWRAGQGRSARGRERRETSATASIFFR